LHGHFEPVAAQWHTVKLIAPIDINCRFGELEPTTSITTTIFYTRIGDDGLNRATTVDKARAIETPCPPDSPEYRSMTPAPEEAYIQRRVTSPEAMFL
jgi:hypothetical protein